MRAHPGTRHFQCHWHLERPRRFDVHQRVDQRVLPVEVGGQPPAAITVQQRVQAEAARRSRLLTGHAALAAALFDPSRPAVSISP
jgi:hypothetical protein